MSKNGGPEVLVALPTVEAVIWNGLIPGLGVSPGLAWGY